MPFELSLLSTHHLLTAHPCRRLAKTVDKPTHSSTTMSPLSVFLALQLLFVTLSSSLPSAAAVTQPFGVQCLSGLGVFHQLAIDNAGFVYGAQADGVVKIAANGSVVQLFNTSQPPGKVVQPWGVAVDSAANVYVSSEVGSYPGTAPAPPGTAVVVKFSPAGLPLQNYSLYEFETDAFQLGPVLAVDSTGALYVTFVFTTMKFNSAGVGVLQLYTDQATAVAVQNGTNAIYEIEQVSGTRIFKFDSSGSSTASAQCIGSGLAVDPRDGTIVVSGQIVQRFTSDLTFIADYTLPEADFINASANIILGVAVSQTGVVYVAVPSGDILALHYEQCPPGYSCPAGVDSALLCPIGSYCPANQTAYGAQVLPCPSSAGCLTSGLVQPGQCSSSASFSPSSSHVAYTSSSSSSRPSSSSSCISSSSSASSSSSSRVSSSSSSSSSTSTASSNASLCLIFYSLAGDPEYPWSAAVSLVVQYNPTPLVTARGTAVQLVSGSGTRTYTNKYGLATTVNITLLASGAIGAGSSDNLLYLDSSLPFSTAGMTVSLAKPVLLPGRGPLMNYSTLTYHSQTVSLSLSSTAPLSQTYTTESDSARIDPSGSAFLSTVPGFTNVTLGGGNSNIAAVRYSSCSAPITFANGARSPVIANTFNSPSRWQYNYVVSDGVSYTIAANLTLTMDGAIAAHVNSLGNQYQLVVAITGTRVYTYLPTNATVTSVVSTPSSVSNGVYQAADQRFYPFALLSSAAGIYTVNTAPFVDFDGLAFSISPGTPASGQAPGVGTVYYQTSVYTDARELSPVLVDGTVYPSNSEYTSGPVGTPLQALQQQRVTALA